MRRKVTFQFKDLSSAPYLDLEIFKDDVTFEEIQNEVYDIISNNKKELIYIDDCLYTDGYLEELDFLKQTDDVKKWVMENPESQLLSTYHLSKMLKSKHPDWFEDPMETEYFRESFPIKDLWESTSI